MVPSFTNYGKGRRQLTLETSKWDKWPGAIARILPPTEERE